MAKISNDFERLPTTLKPLNYKLLLEPDLQKCTFSGIVNCVLQVISATNRVVCNIDELKIHSAKVYLSDSAQQQEHALLASVSVDNSRQLLICTFDTQPFTVGECVRFECEFSGVMDDRLAGLYRSKYVVDGETRWAAVTQFESTDARKCFPCWDEPALKATFDISIRAPSNRVVISNMPEIKRISHSDGTDTVTFDQTPLMSTYLVACVVGEFDNVTARASNGVDITVYTPIGKQQQGAFTLDCAAKILPYYEEYFGIKYPLPKLDLVAVADFASGAMENWGLVTFREMCVLCDPENTSTNRRQWCVQVVGHELAHMWFGNLVTMEWWTHLWLNEGFAEFIMYLSTNYLFPHYKIWQQFIFDNCLSAKEVDSLRDTHRIEVPVTDPAEIEEIFDSISYEKGSCILFMLHEFIGEEKFREGIHQYLKQYAYSNTHTEQLWRSLREASACPVDKLMPGWTQQPGYPLVCVHEGAANTAGGRTLSFTQRRFYSLPERQVSDSNTLWIIPLTFVHQNASSTDGRISHRYLLENECSQFTLDGVNASEWIKLNVGAGGFYRVKYEDGLLDMFRTSIVDKSLPVLDRLSLIDDMFALTESSEYSTAQFVKFCQNYRQEHEMVVLSSLLNCLRRLSVVFYTGAESSITPLFKRYCRDLLQSAYQRYGWTRNPDEDHSCTLVRPLILSYLIKLDHGEVIEEGLRLFRAHTQNESCVDPDLRYSVYKSALKRDPHIVLDILMQMYKDEELQEEKNRIGLALGAAPTQELLQRVLEFAISEHVRIQETVFLIGAVAENKLGIHLAWKFYKQHAQLMSDRYKGRLLSVLIKSITKHFNTQEMYDEVRDYFEKNPKPSAARTISQSLEIIRTNTLWLNRDMASFEQFLNSTS